MCKCELRGVMCEAFTLLLSHGKLSFQKISHGEFQSDLTICRFRRIFLVPRVTILNYDYLIQLSFSGLASGNATSGC